MFKWLDFCQQRNIPYEDKGRNVYVDCPFCTDGKGKGHLGLSTGNTLWGCWKGHKGVHAWYAIKALIRCDEKEAKRIADEGDFSNADFSDLKRRFSGLDTEQGIEDEFRPYTLPRDCFRLDTSRETSDLFLKYLKEKRGIGYGEVLKHDLHGALSGEFAWRVVIPFYREGVLLGATGRHIGNSQTRYHTRPDKLTSRIVYNADEASANPGDALVLVEGPFDAMCLDSVFARHGKPCVAIAMLGLSFGPDKRKEVSRLARGFKRIVVLTDRKAEAHAFKIREYLSGSVRNVSMSLLPDYAKDPAELRERDALSL